MRNNFKLISIILLGLQLLTGCGNEEVVRETIPLVKTQRAGEANVSAESIYSGVVKGRYVTNLAFQVGGQIMSRNVEVGSQVRAGELLGKF